MSDELADYQGLGHALLTPEETHALCLELVVAREAVAAGKRGAAARLKRIVDRLLTANLRLIATLSRRFRGQGISLQDLIQDGAIGFVRALETYDPERGWKLATYATHWISHHMRRSISDASRTIRVPVHLRESRAKFSRLRARELAATGREPDAEELAKRMGIRVSKVEAAIRPMIEPLSLDTPGTDDGAPLSAAIAGDGLDPEAALLAKERAEEARRLLARLPARERDVLERRFADSPETLGDIGARLSSRKGTRGITRERVRQNRTERPRGGWRSSESRRSPWLAWLESGPPRSAAPTAGCPWPPGASSRAARRSARSTARSSPRGSQRRPARRRRKRGGDDGRR